MFNEAIKTSGNPVNLRDITYSRVRSLERRLQRQKHRLNFRLSVVKLQLLFFEFSHFLVCACRSPYKKFFNTVKHDAPLVANPLK